jgi:ABC-type glycerol-3-phosphate transport system permease component
MGQWNNYQAFQISLPNYPNLALGVYELQEKAQQKEYLFLGMVLISSLVPLGLFTAAQKTMLTNMSVGGLKG